MRDIDLRLEFVKFRRDGDVAALATIFDEVAPQLLRLARHLARDAESPEDLVQSTFLTAIEARDSFDASRPLEPWLAGILGNHVSHARRQAARTRNLVQSVASGALAASSSPAVLSRDTTADAADQASEREVWQSIASAIESLPPLYREVVGPRLLADQAPREVARSLGRGEGRVRVQLHRGFELLRRALPRGITAAFAFGWLTRSSLASARRHVLQTASQTMTTAGTLTLPTGIVLMSKKIVFAISAVLLFTVGTVLFVADHSEETRPSVTYVDTRNLPQPPAKTQDEPERIDVDAEALTPSSRNVAHSDVPEAYRRLLCGVRGRLLEADGRPVANTALSLIELDSAHLVADIASAFEEARQEVVLAEARTDAEGRFAFSGMRPRGLHVLGIDLGGKRATLRAIDLPLSSGLFTDLGDLILGPVVAMTGVVVDEGDAPVPNARVRVAILPGPLAMLGLERIDPRKKFILFQNTQWRVIEMPPLVKLAFERVPVPTTQTDSQGRFSLAGVAPGSITAAVDRPGFVPTAFGPSTAKAGAIHDVGKLVLSRGRVVTGVVIDPQKRPIAGAMVIGGTTDSRGKIVCANSEATTDAHGQFVLSAIPEDGRAIFAASCSAFPAWTVIESEGDELEISLAATVEHRLHVTREDGEAIDRLDLRIALRDMEEFDVSSQTSFVACDAQAVAGDPSRFSLHLPPGSYRALLRAEGFSPRTLELEIEQAGQETEVVLPHRRSLSIRVIDARSQLPIDYAKVAAIQAFESRVAPVTAAVSKSVGEWSTSARRAAIGIASTHTDAAGMARLDRVEIDASTRLRVSHPLYAEATAKIGEEPIVIALEPCGSWLGQVRVRDLPPAERLLAIVESAQFGSDARYELPIVAASNALGDIRIPVLAPGTYSFRILRNFLANDLATISQQLATDMQLLSSEPLALGRFEIRAGESVETPIQVVIAGGTGSASLRGHVTRGGNPITNGMIEVAHESKRKTYYLDSQGNYAIEDITPGTVRITVIGGTELANGGTNFTSLESRSITLAPGAASILDFDFEAHPLTVQVTHRGTPVAGAEVNAREIGLGGYPEGGLLVAYTDVMGYARFELTKRCRQQFLVRDDRYAVAAKEVEIQGNGRDPVLVIDLEVGTLLTGSFTLAPEFGELTANSLLMIARDGENDGAATMATIDRKNSTFRCDNAPSGRLTLTLYVNSRPSKAVTLEQACEGVKIEFVPGP